jgi:glycosyltransferase involved in cell wall biosynthesis
MLDVNPTAEKLPLVSVIIPVFNGARVIETTLRCIAAQTFTDYELIVIDDGSTDDTVAVVRGLAPHARIVTQPNAGVSSARNHGVAIARGKWVTFLDADDLWHATRLQTLVGYLEAHRDCRVLATTAKKFCLETDAENVRLIGDWVDFTVSADQIDQKIIHGKLPAAPIAPQGGSARADLGGAEVSAADPVAAEPVLLKKASNFDLLRGNCVLSSAIILDREILMRAGLFPMQVVVGEDYFCWVNVANLTPIWVIDSPTFFYRVSPTSVSRTADMVMPQVAQLLTHWYSGRRKVRTNPKDAADLKEAGYGYAEWHLKEMITKGVRAGNLWRIGAALRMAFFLVPDAAYRRNLWVLVVKEYLKKYLMPGKYARLGGPRASVLGNPGAAENSQAQTNSNPRENLAAGANPVATQENSAESPADQNSPKIAKRTSDLATASV